MMKRNRLIAILLCLALCLSLFAGCGQSEKAAFGSASKGGTPTAALPSDYPNVTPAVSGSYFTEQYHADFDMADAEYVPYDLADFEAYTAPIYALAANGGTESEFRTADDDIYYELYYIDTMCELADLDYYNDPADTAAAEASALALEVYHDAVEEYCLAMSALANSEHAEFLSSGYAQSFIDYFKEYEPSDEESTERRSEETRLVQRYFELMSAEEPDFDAVGEIYVRLVQLRAQTAQAAGYESFADYAYYNWYYKDYTPADAAAVREGAKSYFVPLIENYGGRIDEESMDLYWSDKVDCSEEAVLAAMELVLPQVSSELYAAYRYMRQYNLYDIAQSSKKAETGYTTYLAYLGQPYIFNAATGHYYDFTDMFHEFGHFVNKFYTASDIIFGAPDLDLAELQSQGMEMIFAHFYSDIFGEENGDIIRDDVLLTLVRSVTQGAMYDEFQFRVFAEAESLTPQRVNEIFCEVYEDYGNTPYPGYEHEWMYINHNFESPFYYISYAVSALGALEIYVLSLTDWPAAVDKYLSVAAMDTEDYYYSEALEAAEFSDIFSVDSYKTISEALAGEFRR